MTASRCALWLWYRGDAFRGYQAQPQGPTVQQVLHQALASLGVTRQPSPSGRTDLGVHARMQVVSFLLDSGRSLDELVKAVDDAVPGALGCVRAVRASRKFHAQWSATGKEYRYRLALDGPIGEPWTAHAWAPHTHPRLEGRRLLATDVAKVLEQAVGERDFGAFHESSSPRRPRTLESARVVALPQGLHEVRLVGSGFGRYQVRYLVGTALAVAGGVVDERDWRAALDTGTALGGLKAEPRGLVLWEVRYPPALDPFDRATSPSQERALPFWARSSAT